VLYKVSEWLRASGPGAPAYLSPAPKNMAFSLWTQDMFLAREDGVLLTPPRFDRYQDLEAANALASNAGYKSKASSFYFEGGNILPVGDFLLIGADTITQNGGDAQAICAAVDPTRKPVVLGTGTAVPSEQTKRTNRPRTGWNETLRWKVIDGSRQPLFHIDLFIAPAGKTSEGTPRFLVGCPRRGAQELGHPVWDHALSDQLDEIAAQLSATGADVIRNPMPLIWKDQPDRKQRTWLHLPVNNVVLEDLGPEGRTVWLPCFGGGTWEELASVDDVNAAIWAMLGYSVIRVPNLMALAENLGALHCMAKVVARS
jgi:hypothetical protein